MKKQTKTQVKKVEVLEPTFQNANETVEDRVEFEIQKFNVADATIAEMKSKFENLEIAGIEDKAGMKVVTEALSMVRSFRTGVEKKRKELKDFYLNTGKGIDAEAKRITELLLEVEEPLKAKKEAIDAEIKRIKDEEEAREAKRIDDRVEALKTAGITFDGAFYSIGNEISVDLVTIKDLDDDAFAKLESKVREANEKIQAENRIQELHNERKELLLPLWSFMSETLQIAHFGHIDDAEFKTILDDLSAKKANFEAEKRRQAEENERLANERRELNFEKRSFKLEKEGFHITNERSADFLNNIQVLSVKREILEEASNEEFDAVFGQMISEKKRIEGLVAERAENDRKQAEQEANRRREQEAEEARLKAIEDAKRSRVAILNKIEGAEIVDNWFFDYGDIRLKLTDLFAMDDEQFADKVFEVRQEIATFNEKRQREQEAERIAKLPDVERIERYCEELVAVNVPQLATPAIQEELEKLRDNLRSIVQKTLLNVKHLK